MFVLTVLLGSKQDMLSLAICQDCRFKQRRMFMYVPIYTAGKINMELDSHRVVKESSRP